MDINELQALRSRFLAAKVNKHLIGGAADHADTLEKLAGPVDFRGEKHSAAHLLALVNKAIRVHAAKAAEKAKPAPKIEVKMVAVQAEIKSSSPKKDSAKDPVK